MGVYEADLYIVWKANNLDTFTVDYVKRISKDVFEEWYRNQNRFHKLEHIPTQEELESNYISVQVAAEILNISQEELVKLIRYGEYKERISKRSLQNFLNAQNEYRAIQKEEETDNHINIETKEYISREEAATLARVTKSTITKWIQAGRFKCVEAGKVLRIHRDDFLQWLKHKEEGVY